MVALSGLAAVLLTAAGAVSPIAVGVASGAVLVIALVSSFASSSERFGGPRLPVAFAAVALGVAGAAPVLLREAEGLVPVLVLLTYAMVYDASTYIVGSGATSAWEGPAAGIAAIGTVTLATAAVLAPPFRGASPWLLGCLAAVLTPLGPMLAATFPGDREVRAPAVRRMDSLVVLAPLWSLAAVLVLD
jgi:hypothetical protein